MSCCREQVGLVLLPDRTLNAGYCCEQHHTAFWNEKVSNVVYASSGTLVQITDEAVSAISAVYDGSPLWVYLTIQKKCCDGPCVCGGCRCDGCDCTLRTAEAVGVIGLWFGNRDAASQMPGIVGLLCCGQACNQCFLKKVAIDANWVKLYQVDSSTLMKR